MLLAYPFGSPSRSPRPVRPAAPSRRPVCPGVREFYTACPFPVPSQRPQLFSNSTLPLGACDPSRSKRSSYLPAERSAKSKRPIFPRSPLPAFFRRSSNGSMFRIRYVPFGLLSNKPLGTSFTMRLNHFGVNKKETFGTRFSQVLIAIRTNDLDGANGESAVDKP